MADIEFTCPGCSMVLAAPEEMIGELVECPECQNQMTVPGNVSGASDESEPDAAGDACPECGQTMPPDSVLCMGCGFHIKLGKKITTEFQ